MGALAQFPVLWMPEDDLRLKNAVEGGASLESLAKGAVQFSRRFTLQEIKERWVSILYDPVISAEVSARLMELEHNSSNNSQKLLRPGGLKDNKCDSKKIKSESVRDHYYATRKRIRYEKLRSMEMDLVGPVYASDHNNEMEPLFNTMLGDPKLNQFEPQQPDAGLKDLCFPLVKTDGVETSCTGVTVQPFHAPHEQFNPESSRAEQGNLPNENPRIFEEASLPVEDANMWDANVMAEDQHLLYGPINDAENLLDEFDGLLPDSGVSFDSLEISSPLPEMSLWDINLDIPVPMMPVNDNPDSQNHKAGDILALQFSSQALDGFMPAGPANSLNQGGGPANSESDEYLAEIYDLLDDEIPAMDTDEKPPNDNPLYEGFRPLLLTSPIVADGDQKTIMASIPSDLPESTANNANLGVSCVSDASHAVEGQAFPRSEFQMPSFSLPPLSPARNDFAACILNTEDPLVPNNDDIIIPHSSSSVKDLLELRSHGEAASNLFRKDPENLGKREFSYKAQIGQPTPEKSCSHTSVDCKAPKNLPEAGMHTSHRSTSLLPDFTKRGHLELVMSRGLNHCMNNMACPSETNGLCNKSDDLFGQTPDDQALNRSVGCDDPSMRESLAQHPLSKFEDDAYESDDEIPYYSDVEEMVLEMDLDPVDWDIDLKEKVLQYRSNDAKKTIIRLEQAAHSYTRRAIARKGAFAVLYGRNSKHYIKKSEVLLGRGTDDSQVDIDLGADGRAHKVSRRQAVIKLEADGNFYIKNIGKRSIYKNNLELATGKTTRLESGSLIEIQKIPFVFEDNPICVRQHLRNIHKQAKPNNVSQKPPE